LGGEEVVTIAARLKKLENIMGRNGAGCAICKGSPVVKMIILDVNGTDKIISSFPCSHCHLPGMQLGVVKCIEVECPI
jgi:hypothetical protein